MEVPVTEEHGYISDASSFDQLKRMFEERRAGERMFLFNVTIQNHGSYTDEDYKTRVYLTDEPGAYPMAAQYLTLERETQEASLDLIKEQQNEQEPVLVIRFGDHQAAGEEECLD